MADPPTVDPRRRDALAERFRTVAPYYTEAYDPDTDGAGPALTNLVAELFGDVTARLDRVPAKHRAAFYDLLGFDQRPAQPARLPLSVSVAPEIDRTIPIAGGTAAVAPGADGGPEQTFTIPDAQAFAATPARITGVYSVDPTVDRVCAHWEPDEATGLIDGHQQLFVDHDRQAHHLYLGDSDGLTVDPLSEGGPRVVRVAIDASDPDRLATLQWAVHGEAPDPGFHPVERAHVLPRSEGRFVVDLLTHVEPTATTIGGVESLWLRATLPDRHSIAAVTDLSVGPTIEFGPGPEYPETGDGGGGGETGPTTKSMAPDRLLADDVELPIGAPEAENGAADPVFHPLGTTPRRESAFYIAADEVLSKPDVGLTWRFEGLDLANHPSEDGSPPVPPLTSDATDRYEWVREDRQPRLAWEYYDGAGWSRIPDLTDDTRSLTGSPGESTVTFPVPSDLEATTVAGHEHRWIRARLVGGDYGTWTSVERKGGWTSTDVTFPPVFDRLTVEYRSPGDAPDPPGDAPETDPASAALAAPSQVRAANHLAVGPNRADATDPIRPFEALPEADQTLYLGFDRTLSGGPITLFVDLADRAVPPEFRPRIEWEYSADPTGEQWTACQTQDGTVGFGERGIVRLTLPGESVAAERFGRRAHWLRARVTDATFATRRPEPIEIDREAIVSTLREPVTGDRLSMDRSIELNAGDTAVEFTSDGGSVTDASASIGATRQTLLDPQIGAFQRADRERPPCGRDLPTEPPTGDPTERPPTVRTLATNAAWASNVRSIGERRLGASSGDPDQSFAVAETPILEETVWVEESATLSADERERLQASDDHAVRIERDGGEISAVWVAWTAASSLLDADPDDRRYAVDRTAGTVTFGDGTHGAIPPAGEDACRIAYTTGGGPAGNVDRGAIAGLKSSIQFVDGVTNPAPGTGGAATERPAAVADRASRELRDRDRAVAAADYERIAADASRRLARVSCLPDLDDAGEHAPGWVTVVIVPEADRPRPTPRTGLIEQVEAAVADRAPAGLVADDRLVVRGPSYVGIDVDLTIRATGAGAAAGLDRRVEDRLEAFVHPLDGRDGAGWPFGELPARSDLYARVEAIDGVDRLDRLMVRYRAEDRSVTVREGDRAPGVAPDALVFADAIDVGVSISQGRTD